MACASLPTQTFQVDLEYARLTELVPGLFICGVSEVTPENIQRYQITLVINATSEVPTSRLLGNVNRLKLWLDDTSEADIYPHLNVISDRIEEVLHDDGKVMVHCVAGVSRSAALCLAYLTKYRCASLREAYIFMSAVRPMVRPNLGFWRSLITFEQEIRGRTASVQLVHDEAQEEQLLPDVYLDQARDSGIEGPSSEGLLTTSTHTSSGAPRAKRKFKPTLQPLDEQEGPP